MAIALAPKHRVSISVGGFQIDGWIDYEISTSLLEPVDQFVLSRPFDRDAYALCRRDALVTVRIDGTPIVTGRIDVRDKETSRESNVMMISGRDMVGRLVQESAPTISYDGVSLVDAVKALASPWYSDVRTSNATNRTVRLGKRGRKAAAKDEAIVIKVKKKTWQVEPGQLRWKIINDLASQAGYMVWASSDGSHLIIGQPNYKQGAQYLISIPDEKSRLPATTFRAKFTDSNADRYSQIMALGSGRGDSANYGESTVSRRDVVNDGPGVDGIGRDFEEPKRLILVERTLANIEEARQYAQQEKDRRDFSRSKLVVTMPEHGQIVGSGAPTLFAPDTIARVIDTEQDPPIDGPWMIYACTYKARRGTVTTDLQLVPSGTVFVQ